MIKMSQNEIHAYLNSLYHNPKKTGSFGGVKALYRAAHRDGQRDITLSQIKSFLRSDETYTLFKPARRRFKRSRTIVGGIDQEYEMDLADLSKWQKYNDNYSFLLVAIDVFSRYVIIFPLKSKSADAILRVLENLVRQVRKPKVSVYTDRGREWENKKVSNFLEKHSIKHFQAHNNDLKAGMAERVILDMKRYFSRYMSENETYRYIDVLQDFARNHNYTFNRSIGM